MAYSASGLCRMGGDSNGNMWTYTTTDTIATVNSSGYFNDSANMLKVRDTIIVKDTNTPTSHHCIVLSNTGTVVDISDGTVIAETDTD